MSLLMPFLPSFSSVQHTIVCFHILPIMISPLHIHSRVMVSSTSCCITLFNCNIPHLPRGVHFACLIRTSNTKSLFLGFLLFPLSFLHTRIVKPQSIRTSSLIPFKTSLVHISREYVHEIHPLFPFTCLFEQEHDFFFSEANIWRSYRHPKGGFWKVSWWSRNKTYPPVCQYGGHLFHQLLYPSLSARKNETMRVHLVCLTWFQFGHVTFEHSQELSEGIAISIIVRAHTYTNIHDIDPLGVLKLIRDTPKLFVNARHDWDRDSIIAVLNGKWHTSLLLWNLQLMHYSVFGTVQNAHSKQKYRHDREQVFPSRISQHHASLVTSTTALESLMIVRNLVHPIPVVKQFISASVAKLCVLRSEGSPYHCFSVVLVSLHPCLHLFARGVVQPLPTPSAKEDISQVLNLGPLLFHGTHPSINP